MSVTRWYYRNTDDLVCPHASASNNTSTSKTDVRQVEFRWQNSSGAESKWHRPATQGTDLTGLATFPAEITGLDSTKMSQVKIYLDYSPISAYRDGVTHVECKIKANRAIDGLELIRGFLIQDNEVGGIGYGNNQGLQWDVFKEPLNLTTETQTFVRAIPIDHIKKQADAQSFQPRHFAFYYWRMEGVNGFRPGDKIEFSFRFLSQPFALAPTGTRSTTAN